jgi:hypothetical protein
MVLAESSPPLSRLLLRALGNQRRFLRALSLRLLSAIAAAYLAHSTAIVGRSLSRALTRTFRSRSPLSSVKIARFFGYEHRARRYVSAALFGYEHRARRYVSAALFAHLFAHIPRQLLPLFSRTVPLSVVRSFYLRSYAFSRASTRILGSTVHGSTVVGKRPYRRSLPHSIRTLAAPLSRRTPPQLRTPPHSLHRLSHKRFYSPRIARPLFSAAY